MGEIVEKSERKKPLGRWMERWCWNGS